MFFYCISCTVLVYSFCVGGALFLFTWMAKNGRGVEQSTTVAKMKSCGKGTNLIRQILLAALWVLGHHGKNQIHNKSIFYLSRLLYCHVYFRFCRQSIFSKYTFDSCDSTKRAFIALDNEYSIEYPVSQKQLEHEGAQEVLLAAMRSSGEFLFVRMVRATQRQAQVYLLLKDHKGRLFENVQNTTGHLPLDISQNNMFHAGGLRMTCIEPMRKWRISFNGMMLNKETGEAMYIRFVFIWSAHTDVFDWHNMVPTHRLIDYCLDPEQKLYQTISAIELCQDYLRGFEQTGYLVGMLQVGNTSAPSNEKLNSTSSESQMDEEPEQELHLRGNFVRMRHPRDDYGVILGEGPHLIGFAHSFVYSVKGQMLQLSCLKFANNERALLFGSFVGTSGFKDPIESIIDDKGNEVDSNGAFTSPVLNIKTFELSHDLLRSEGEILSSSKSFLGWNTDLRISTFDAMIDGNKAFGIFVQGVLVGVRNNELIKPPLNIIDHDYLPSPAPYVVNLKDPHCKNCNLTGGKGSSLAILMELSSIDLCTSLRTKDDMKVKFAIPSGIVVTTAAFKRFMQSPAMAMVKRDLNNVLATTSVEEMKSTTTACAQRVAREPMPSCIADDIVAQLQNLFPDLPSKRFAVRSSCAGEDSEDMSAAGQMETFLGVKGEKEIITAVAKCWASQFYHVAVGYKRRYGQELVSEMAVVIMEMVPADCAGVMFTCDPLTGNPSTIYITSNFGLGESVVSAMVDLDTVRISRDINGHMKVNDIAIGKKDLKIVMDLEAGGTREEKIISSIGETARSSLSSKQATLLAYVGAAIERCYGDWRDIEWAFAEETLFVLQARPVTFIDRPTDFEIATEFDCAAPAENSCYSKANVGEVLHGSLSPLGIDVILKVCLNSIINGRIQSARERRYALHPYGSKLFRIARQHFFMDLSEIVQFIPDLSDTRAVESQMLNLCGRIIDDPDLYIGDTSDLPRSTSFFERHNESIQAKWLSNIKIRIFRWLSRRLARFPASTMTINELFKGLLDSITRAADYGMSSHQTASIGSSLWSNDIVNFLSSHTDESMETIYGDLSKLLSSANNVVSCDAPRDIEALAAIVSREIGKDTFVNASSDAAFAMLKGQDTFPQSCAAFAKFLNDHGHRGYNEFDVYQQVWSSNPELVIGTIQTMMRNDLHENSNVKTHESVWTAVNSIHCKLTFWQKIRLSVMVHLTRKAVGSRENSKSLMIWNQDVCRQWCWALATKMHKEGRLPDKTLLFFCTINEINTLLRVRDPAIIARAYHRQRLYPELVALQFPEYSRGIVRPIVEEPPIFEDGVVKIKGFPISKGRIQAKARVITKLEEAASIQRGEILITYATDIGWSPYFPLLSGIATELGGLMSHGAVVAREYGLPCVVGVFGARQAFRTGDAVLLDGTKGYLLRIEEAQEAVPVVQ
ncbi:hypothetical protein BIW11_02569 [Tropilaelaps mercedesae]|uniref:Phosphoenolpyruvate synthase-like n=1 Tax=Tropilaelaps mercedesae TaxID=418985 RepID=A0A1V9Y0X2_9ACAR|nr:hypothetical protein BIW11_02569 [Tropilaelaps mercedesae]